MGFSTNSAAPFSTTTPMQAPFYNFPANRMNTSTTPWTYNDVWGNPYVYNTTKNSLGDYDGSNSPLPMYDATGKAQNFTTFQLYSNGPPTRVGASVTYPHPLQNW
jgi:hypothetical protein